MLTRFFIDRPIFASVISLLILLAGGATLPTLPVAQYPAVAPPTIQLDCHYPGASANVVAEAIAAPIEQQVNGVENMLYMASQCTNDGSYTLTVTFKPGVDLNLAQVMLQNRFSLALPQLPEEVRQTGVVMRKRSPEILLTVSLNSPNGKYDQLYLSNYAQRRIRDEMSRLPGVSEVLLFGQRDYSMRLWIDPDQLATRNLTVSDVMAAVRSENLQPAIGHLAQPPTHDGPARQIPLTVRGRLVHEDEFDEIVIKRTEDGRVVRFKDVGRAELNAKSQDINSRFDGKPTIGLAVFMLSDGNALETGDRVKELMERLSKDFPEGVAYEIGYDTTPFIRESIGEVVKSLRDAVILVALVVLIFLQGWRAAIIPLLAIPVAIIGTFFAIGAAGFSINNLTLFGLVLSIGIVVDDAIVVVEAVEHFIARGMRPREAALKAMEEVSGPVIAVGLVLSAVFFPCAFLSGIVGEFYRQFALTIAVSTLLSTLNSLTLSPALAAMLLLPKGAKPDGLTRLFNLLFGWFFRLFDRGLALTTSGYTRIVGGLLRVPALVLAAYVGLLGLTGWTYGVLPKGFIPAQDKGYLIASVQLPDSSSAGRTREVIAHVEKICLETPGVKNINSIAGNSFILSAYGSNFGSMFIILKGFDDRRDPALHSDKIAAKIKDRIAKEVPEASINIFPPPAVSGLGRAGGFRIMVEDRGDAGLVQLQQATDDLIALANKEPTLSGLFTVFKVNSPQLYVDIDRDQCFQQGVKLSDLFATLSASLGSRYVNDFNRFGRTWQVIVQSEAPNRDQVEDVKQLKVRNQHGTMVPVGALATVKPANSPLVLTRYNMYPAATINGNVAAGVSTGQGIEALEALARRELPGAMAFEWTELTFLERSSMNTGPIMLGLSVVFVFLVLAALYESWSLPLAVILVVPMCVLCALGGVWLRAMDINVFTQIGFIVLVGLACKNAILIVEFAKRRRQEGVERRAATLEACELRLRPILMTSFAFILGVTPLLAATGAGAEMRRTLGVTVFWGMLGVTIFGVFLTPVFFLVIDRLTDRSRSLRPALERIWSRIPVLPLIRRGARGGSDLETTNGIPSRSP